RIRNYIKMDVYNFDYKSKNLNNIFETKSTIILGKFNIFHKGHQNLLDNAKALSSQNKIGITIFTSENKTGILPLQSRLDNLAELGFDFVVVINFNFDIKSLHAKDFIDHIVTKYNVDNFVVGKDFGFGLNRMWDSKKLQEYFPNTTICDIQKINEIKISSSSISEMITTGEIGLVNQLLTNIYNPIIQYDSFELVWDSKLVKPHNGIYFIKMEIDGYWYHGLLHVAMSKNDKIKLLNYEEDFVDGSYLIQVFQECRIIINSRFDSIFEDDQKKCLEFFHTLQKSIYN
ncbi:MAG: FAD synthase, partial [Metamycoplasmataceae bacterium]